MNKLYKYLPFDIECVANFTSKEYGLIENQKGVLHQIDRDGYLTITWNLVYSIDVHSNYVKPILRPFEYLTKELPLTKAAAEMINGEEGVTVNCANELFYIITGGFQWSRCSLKTIVLKENTCFFEVIKCTKSYSFNKELDDYEEKTIYSNPFTLFSFNNKFEIALFTKAQLKIKLEKALDFLRAMHFAVDFEEGEYIKYS